jgi:hypothetical protein
MRVSRQVDRYPPKSAPTSGCCVFRPEQQLRETSYSRAWRRDHIVATTDSDDNVLCHSNLNLALIATTIGIGSAESAEQILQSKLGITEVPL